MGTGVEKTAVEGHELRRLVRRCGVLASAILMIVAAPGTAMAGGNLTPGEIDAEVETHCVIDVLDVLLGGEFVVSDPICFPSFDEAMAFVGLAPFESGEALVKAQPDLTKPIASKQVRRSTEPPASTTASGSSFVIGIHFKNRNGGGSSVTLTGTSCSGGYWNASSSWRNVISSSYNGCARLKHFSELYVSGSRYDTVTAGQTDNIYGSMDNSTKSISYHSS